MVAPDSTGIDTVVRAECVKFCQRAPGVPSDGQTAMGHACRTLGPKTVPGECQNLTRCFEG